MNNIVNLDKREILYPNKGMIPLTYKSLDEKNKFFSTYINSDRTFEKIESREEFDKLFSYLNNSKNIIFRGVNEAKFRMYTSLQRAYQCNKIDLSISPSNFIRDEISNLRNCKKHLLNRYYRSLNLTDSDYLYLSYLQHYGAVTPFLDFSKNIRISLYFATSNVSYCSSSNDIDSYFSLYWMDLTKMFELPDIIEEHKKWYQQAVEMLISIKIPQTSIDTSNLKIDRFLSWDNTKHNTSGLRDIPLGLISNNLSTRNSISPEQVTASLENVKQKAVKQPITISDSAVHSLLSRANRCITQSARVTNLNIVAQEGCFILFNPCDIQTQRGVNIPLELYWSYNPTFKNLPNLYCANIHKSLANYIQDKLAKNGVTESYIYPNNNDIAKEALHNTTTNNL